MHPLVHSDSMRWLAGGGPRACIARSCAALLLGAALAASDAGAQTGTQRETVPGTDSGLPVPRFVSIKASPVNVRGGPSTNHRVVWVFVRAGVPVEVTAEIVNWRRIRDVDGDQGWVFHSLLDGARHVMVVGPDPARPREGDPMAQRRAPEAAAEPVALVEPGVIGELGRCEDGWCAVRFGAHEGFMPADALYGVYPEEAG